MFIEPTITWVLSGFSGYIWLDIKNCVKKPQNLLKIVFPARLSPIPWTVYPHYIIAILQLYVLLNDI